ncbi:MAG: mechanosensitive ion channel family protein [Sulfolobales archaeon]|nr:mechanosensitive ion channel family protein [Sulfolobales archaeon]MCX8186182.1 mechanosensitive ion channel family protein [Sulfolobales archaeon]MDW7969477.1 mechanosensitive ion channel family protein [Sulfolobales archaeon]
MLLDVISGGIELFIRILLALSSIAISYYLGIVFSNYIKKSKLRAPPELVYNIMKSVRLIMLFIGILVGLSIIGLDLSGILVAAGFAGIVVGLATQQTLSQVFAGLSMLIEGRVKVGDSVRVGDDWGVVESVGIMSTQIRLWSGEVVTIPNNDLMASKIYNYSKPIARRIEVSIGISYKSDIEKALKTIREVLDSKELVLAEPAPSLIVDSLGESSVNIRILFWVPSQEFWTIRREIIKEIKEALERSGVEIPFPQRVVWIQTKWEGK